MPNTFDVVDWIRRRNGGASSAYDTAASGGLGRYDYDRRMGVLSGSAGKASSDPNFLLSAQNLIINSAGLSDEQFASMAAQTYGFQSSSQLAADIGQFQRSFEDGRTPGVSARNALQSQWDKLSKEEQSLLRQGFGAASPTEIYDAHVKEPEKKNWFEKGLGGVDWAWDHSFGEAQHGVAVAGSEALKLADKPFQLVQRGMNTLIYETENRYGGEESSNFLDLVGERHAPEGRNKGWGNAWREAGKGERGMAEFVKDQARTALGGDEEAFNIAVEAQGVREKDPIPKAIQNVIRKEMGVGDDVQEFDLALLPGYADRFSELYEKTITPGFAKALGVIAENKVSYGRWYARSLGLSPDPDGGLWSPWNLVSGSFDLGFDLVADPTNWVGVGEVKAGFKIGVETVRAGGSLRAGLEGYRAAKGLVGVAEAADRLQSVGRFGRDVRRSLLHNTKATSLGEIENTLARRSFSSVAKDAKIFEKSADGQVTKKLTKGGKDYLREVAEVSKGNRSLAFAVLVADTFNRDLISPDAITSLKHMANASGGPRLGRAVYEFAKHDIMARHLVDPTMLDTAVRAIGEMTKIPAEGLSGVERIVAQTSNLRAASGLVTAQSLANVGTKGGLRSLTDYVSMFDQADEVFGTMAGAMLANDALRLGRRSLEKGFVQLPRLSESGMLKMRSKMFASHTLAEQLRAGSEFIISAGQADFLNATWFEKMRPAYITNRARFGTANAVKVMSTMLPRGSSFDLMTSEGLDELEKFLKVGLDNERSANIIGQAMASMSLEARRQIARNGMAEAMYRLGVNHEMVDHFIRQTGDFQKIYSSGAWDVMSNPLSDVVEARTALYAGQATQSRLPLPKIRDLFKNMEKMTFLQASMNHTFDSRLMEGTMNYWRPGVLLRFGFPVRAAGEESLAWIAKTGFMTPVRSWILDPLRDPAIPENEVPGLLNPLARIERRTRHWSYRRDFNEMVRKNFDLEVEKGFIAGGENQFKKFRSQFTTMNGKVPFMEGDSHFVHEFLLPKINEWMISRTDDLTLQAMRTFGRYGGVQNAEAEDILGSSLWETKNKDQIVIDGDRGITMSPIVGKFEAVNPARRSQDPMWTNKVYSHFQSLAHDNENRIVAAVFAEHVSDGDADFAADLVVKNFKNLLPDSLKEELAAGKRTTSEWRQFGREYVTSVRKQIHSRKLYEDLERLHLAAQSPAEEKELIGALRRKWRKEGHLDGMATLLKAWPSLSPRERFMFLQNPRTVHGGLGGNFVGKARAQSRRLAQVSRAGYDSGSLGELADALLTQYRSGPGLEGFVDTRRAFTMPDGRVVQHIPAPGMERVWLPTTSFNDAATMWRRVSERGMLDTTSAEFNADLYRQANSFARLHGYEKIEDVIEEGHAVSWDFPDGILQTPIHLDGSLNPDFAIAAYHELEAHVRKTNWGWEADHQLASIDIPGNYRTFPRNMSDNDARRVLDRDHPDPQVFLNQVQSEHASRVRKMNARHAHVDELLKEGAKSRAARPVGIADAEPEELGAAIAAHREIDPFWGDELVPDGLEEADLEDIYTVGTASFLDAMKDANSRLYGQAQEQYLDAAGNVRYDLAVPVAAKKWSRLHAGKVDMDAISAGMPAPVYETVTNPNVYKRFTNSFFENVADPVLRSMVRNPMYRDLYVQAYRASHSLLWERLVDQEVLDKANLVFEKFGLEGIDRSHPHEFLESLDAWVSKDRPGVLSVRQIEDAKMDDLPAFLAQIMEPSATLNMKVAELDDTIHLLGKKLRPTATDNLAIDALKDQLSKTRDKLHAALDSRNADLQAIGHARSNMDRALTQVDRIAHTNSMNEAIQFIDDTAIRSQFGERIKNVIPFWFAEEQFAKRWARIFKRGDLKSLHKVQLLHHALDSAGLVERDEFGNEVYTLPFSGAVVSLLRGPLQAVFGKDAGNIPFEMKADLMKSIPGLGDFPNASVSPVLGVAINRLADRFPEMEGFRQSVLQQGAGKGILETFVPSSLSRAWQAVGEGDTEKNFAGTVVNAMQILEFNELEWQSEHPNEQEKWYKYGLRPDANAREKEEYNDRVRRWAHNVLAVKAFYGFLSPGSPQIVHQDSMTNKFRKILSNVGSYEEAAALMAKEYPGATVYDIFTDENVEITPSPSTPFTVFKSKNETGAPLPATLRTYNWMVEHKQFLEENPEAGPWLIPQDNADGDAAYYGPTYKWQVREGMRRAKLPAEFLDSMRYAEAARMFFPQSDAYDRAIVEADSPEMKQILREDKTGWQKSFFDLHPTFEQEYTDPSRHDKRQKTIDSLESLLLPGGTLSEDSAYDAHRVLVGAFRDYTRLHQNSMANGTDAAREWRSSLQQSYYSWMYDYSLAHPEVRDLFDRIFRLEMGLNGYEQDVITGIQNERTAQNDPLLQGSNYGQ